MYIQLPLRLLKLALTSEIVQLLKVAPAFKIGFGF